jgi:glutamyl-tRNA reductase
MIGVLGTSHKCADLATREAIAKAFSSCNEALQKDSVFLLTCNRAEWYFCTHTPARTHQEMISHLRTSIDGDCLSHLYTFFGLECFHHLGAVVSGLDSVFLGETEIQGQVKAAYDTARQKRWLPKELHFLFQKALHTGKIVREKIQFPEQQNLCDKISVLVSQHIHQLSTPSILLIGSSMINRKLAQKLKICAAPITIANRTDTKAVALADEIGGTAISWTQLSSLWPTFSCIIAATRSEEYLLRPSDCTSPSIPQLLIDLGAPRNVDPKLASSTRKIVNIESLSPTEALETVLAHRSWNDYLSLSRRS